MRLGQPKIVSQIPGSKLGELAWTLDVLSDALQAATRAETTCLRYLETGLLRVGSTVLVIPLALSALIGCGPAFHGSIPGRDGNGLGPIVLPGQAQVTAVSPSSVTAGSAGFTITVTGLDFLPTTTVLWEHAGLATTYVSTTTLTAQVPASLLARPATVTLVPSPLKPFNFGVSFTVEVPPLVGSKSPFSLSKVTVASNDLEWDPVSQQFYLSVVGGSGANANSITALNPQTGLLGPSISTGSQPGKLAVSTDGTYIYVGLDSAASVQRYTLPALQHDIDIPLGSSNYDPFYAIDIQPEPGSAHSVAVSRGVRAFSPLETGGVVLYDDAAARPQAVPGFGPVAALIDALVWNPNGLSLYGLDTESGTGVSIMSVSSAGVQLQSQAPNSGSGFHLHFDSTTGYLYSDNGVVTDPATNAVVGSFSFKAVQGGFSTNPIMVPDGKLNIAYFLGRTSYAGAPGDYVLAAFDLTHLTFLGAIPIPGMAGTPSKIIRWGSNGLAFLTGDPYGTGAAQDGVYLFSGGFVTSPAP